MRTVAKKKSKSKRPKPYRKPKVFRGKRITDRKSTPDDAILRKRVRKRDGYKCVLCGSRKKLQVHHIFPYATYIAWRRDENNLCTVCSLCHKNKITGNEECYQMMLINIVQRNNG